MKKLLTASVLLLVIAALPLSHLLMAGKEKVVICHVTKSNFLFATAVIRLMLVPTPWRRT